MDQSVINLVEWLLKLFDAYKMAGIIFGIIFVVLLVQRIDPAARTWALGFRILILPGVVFFWPLFLYRLLRGKGVPTERNAHRQLAARPSIDTPGASG